MKILNGFILILFIALSASAQKTLSPVGTWKIADIELVKTPNEMSQENKQLYIKETKENNRIVIKGDKTYESTGVEDVESGNWRMESGGKILYFDKVQVKAKSTGQTMKLAKADSDKFTINMHTSDVLKGTLKLSDGTEARLDLRRIK